MVTRLFRWSLRLAALAAFLVLWVIAIEPSRLVVREETLTPPGWHGSPLRVALISDIHVGSPWITLGYLERLVAKTNAQKPDLILLLGDYDINGIPGGTKTRPEKWAPILGRLEAPLGVHAVLGNHDWWNDTPRIRKALESAGIEVHENEAIRITGHTSPFWLVGIGDSFSGHDRIKRAFAGVPAKADVLAFTHAPEVVTELGERTDVLVAGHTHGGQVLLPWITDHHLKLPWLKGAYRGGRRTCSSRPGSVRVCSPRGFVCRPRWPS